MAQRGLDGDEDGAHVDVEREVEVFQRDLVDGAQLENAGVVDQDVEPAEGARGFVDRGAQRSGIGAVDAQRQRAAACGFDAGGELLGCRLVAGIAEGDGGAVLGEAPHDGGADAARAAGDEGDLAGEDGLGRGGWDMVCFRSVLWNACQFGHSHCVAGSR